jgi:hypothetical protein
MDTTVLNLLIRVRAERQSAAVPAKEEVARAADRAVDERTPVD